jgi:HK97 family phage prohead protease
MNIEDKLKVHYGVKTTSVKITDLDEGSRQVKGYFASFDTLDSDMDVIRKGAFSKSIQERGVNSTGNRKIAHLRNHNWDMQIGALTELSEDSKGLSFVSTLGRSTKGNDALLDYQDGILREHSIGFNYVSDRIKFIEESTFSPDGHFDVTEVKLWEGSGVTFGSNSLTPVVDVAKGEKDIDIKLKKIHELTTVLEGALKNGQGTDERLLNIEQMFAQLKQLHESLTVITPSVKDTLKSTPTEEEKRKQVLINLITK